MSESATKSFSADCPHCDVALESNDFEEVLEYTDKHHDHTGHTMEWKRADFDIKVKTETKWDLKCYQCDEDWRFDTKDEAKAFQDEHAQFTDHEIRGSPTKVEIDLTSDKEYTIRNIKSLVESLEERYENGVPVEVIYYLLVDDISDISRVESEIQNLYRKGTLYKPYPNRLRTP